MSGLNRDKFPRLCKFLTENGSIQPRTRGVTECSPARGTVQSLLWRIVDVKIWLGTWPRSGADVCRQTCQWPQPRSSLNFPATKRENAISSTPCIWFLAQGKGHVPGAVESGSKTAPASTQEAGFTLCCPSKPTVSRLDERCAAAPEPGSSEQIPEDAWAHVSRYSRKVRWLLALVTFMTSTCKCCLC